MVTLVKVVMQIVAKGETPHRPALNVVWITVCCVKHRKLMQHATSALTMRNLILILMDVDAFLTSTRQRLALHHAYLTKECSFEC